jgi:hypothetical protein
MRQRNPSTVTLQEGEGWPGLGTGSQRGCNCTLTNSSAKWSCICADSDRLALGDRQTSFRDT